MNVLELVVGFVSAIATLAALWYAREAARSGRAAAEAAERTVGLSKEATAYVAATDEERRRNMERERAKMLQGLRAAISAGAEMSGNIRGVVFGELGPESALDLQGVRVFTDVSFQRELLEGVE